MKVSYEGQVYDFDLMRISTDELREMKRKLNLTPAKFLQGIAEADVDAMAALKWVVFRSDGQHDDLVLSARDPFPDYWQFLQAWNEADEQKPEDEPDPTAAGSLPATPTQESSESSPATSTSSAVITPSPSPGTAVSGNGKSEVSPSPVSSPISPA